MQRAQTWLEVAFILLILQDKANAEQSIKNGKSKIVADNGQLVRISKDSSGIISRETLTKH